MRPESETVFSSILWPRAAAPQTDMPPEAISTLHDLALDQVLSRIAESAPAARAAWVHPLTDLADVSYRQQVFSGLEDRALRTGVREFLRASAQCARLEDAAGRSRSRVLGELLHCRALEVWVGAVRALDAVLHAYSPDAPDTADADTPIEGASDEDMTAETTPDEIAPTENATAAGTPVGAGPWELLGRHVESLRGSPDFTSLQEDAHEARRCLESFRYDALLRTGRITVAPTQPSEDLLEHARQVLARFQEPDVRAGHTPASTADDASSPGHTPASAANRAGTTGSARTSGSASTADDTSAETAGMIDHVQLWMLEHASALAPELFAPIHEITVRTADFRDPVLDRFVDEVRFYLALLDVLAPMRRAGLPVCLPQVHGVLTPSAPGLPAPSAPAAPAPSAPGSPPDDETLLDVEEAWDLALGARLTADGAEVVTNDVVLRGEERILVVSGPNQGGKTTLARTAGQLHHLAALGCPVPAAAARIPMTDQVTCLFEREEDLDAAEGRLATEVTRLHAMLERATGRSLLVINEAFASTALADARVLTRDVLERIIALDAIAVCVTFIDELSGLGPATVSMVAQVDPDDPAHRTLRVVRAPAAGRAYARALAQRHGLSSALIAERLAEPVSAR